MKKKILFLSILMFLVSASVLAEEVELHPVTGFPAITDLPYVAFNEGVCAAQVNRLERQEKRSNFVRETYMVGAYCEMEVHNLKPMDMIVKVSAFYPLYHRFNGMRQFPKQVILYSFDLMAGPQLHFDMWRYITFNLGAGIHYMYQLSDEFHLQYFGLGVLGDIELPVHKYWTVIAGGNFSLDYPNFGTNRKVQPYDMAWQYQVELGVRFSKKAINQYSYISSRVK